MGANHTACGTCYTQADQHDYAFRTKQNMSGLIAEMAALMVRVEDLQDYTPPH